MMSTCYCHRRDGLMASNLFPLARNGTRPASLGRLDTVRELYQDMQCALMLPESWRYLPQEPRLSSFTNDQEGPS